MTSSRLSYLFGLFVMIIVLLVFQSIGNVNGDVQCYPITVCSGYPMTCTTRQNCYPVPAPQPVQTKRKRHLRRSLQYINRKWSSFDYHQCITMLSHLYLSFYCFLLNSIPFLDRSFTLLSRHFFDLNKPAHTWND
jgi:hypothetical protein